MSGILYGTDTAYCLLSIHSPFFFSKRTQILLREAVRCTNSPTFPEVLAGQSHDSVLASEMPEGPEKVFASRVQTPPRLLLLPGDCEVVRLEREQPFYQPFYDHRAALKRKGAASTQTA